MKKLLFISIVALTILSGCKKVDIPEAPNKGLEKISNLQYSVSGQALTLTWNLPSAQGVTGVQIIKNMEGVTVIDTLATSYYLRRADTNQELTYTVKAIYGKMVSEGVSIKFTIPYEKNAKAAYLLTASTIDALPSENEKAAANWFQTKYVDKGKGEFIFPSQLPSINSDVYSVLWIYLDRQGIGKGWQNLPESVSSTESVAALKAYVEDAGKLLLCTHATQLVNAIGRIEETYAPNIFGDGAAITGEDTWTMNANIGNGTYDRRKNKFFKKMTSGDPNGYGYDSFLMIGPGERMDHNCMWDCGAFGFPGTPDIISDFQVATGSVVLSTWGHVTDFCCAGMVEFQPKDKYLGYICCIGLSAYQFYQKGGNLYQANIETLTSNVIDNYMK